MSRFLSAAFYFKRAALLQFRILLALCWLAMIAGWLGGLHWFLELFSHFVPFYCLGAIVLSVAMLLIRDWRFAPAVLLAAAINVALIAPYYWDTQAGSAENAPTFRVLSANVFTINDNHAGFLAMTDEYDPDLICIQEPNWEWKKGLAELKKEYPHAVVVPRPDNFGIAVYSKHPFKREEIIRPASAGVPAIDITVATPQGDMHVLNIHTLPPMSPDYARERDAMLEFIADYAADRKGPAIIVGDMNVTTWSPVYRNTIGSSRLRNARRGFGLLPTWPGPAWPIAIPIDHILVSPEIFVKDMRLGPSFNSDHLPLIANLQIREGN